MEVPVINRIGDFETGLNSLQNPSFLSRVLSLSGMETVSQAYSFCKWGALIFAFLASLSAIMSKIKLLIIKFQKENSLSSQTFLQHFDFSEDDDDDEDDSSCCSSSGYDSQEDIDSLYERYNRETDDVFRVKGSGFNSPEDNWSSSLWSIGDQLSEIASGKSVVKLWDNLGLGLGFRFDGDCFSSSSSHRSCTSSSLEDASVAQNIFDRIPTVSPSSPAVVVAAGLNSMKDAAVRVWDTRLACRKPAILGDWRPKIEKEDGVKIDGVKCGGVRKVILRTGEDLTVGDMRNMRSPLGNVTECDVETWWDADAAIVGDDLERMPKTKWL